MIRTVLAVAACKLSRTLLRMTGKGGGTALPGKAAMFFRKDILAVTSEGMEIIVITGTNGKTTTSNMIEHALTAAGRKVLINRSGANLLSGVTAEVTCAAGLTGKPGYDCAVIECDEGALKQVVPLLKPKAIVVTNLFRDQLDRYGEVMHTLEAIRTGIKLVPEATICLNADDSLTASLALDTPNPVVYYGMNVPAGEQKMSTNSDATHCIRCGRAYAYRYHTYSHLGGFYCPACGYKRPDADAAVTAIGSMDESGTVFTLSLDERLAKEKKSMEVRVSLPALYNVYNACAAAAGALLISGTDPEGVVSSLGSVVSSFGRMETFTPGRETVQMILVKNPAGCGQSIEFVSSLKRELILVFGLNDRTADGHDISWIWDCDHEKLAEAENIREYWVFGDRAADMQLRLKYAGIPEAKIHLAGSTDALLSMMKESSCPVYVLPNYTSMLELREVLRNATGKKEFWN